MAITSPTRTRRRSRGFRTEFVNNFLNTISLGSTPNANNAGTNPLQFGQGSSVGSLGVDFGAGGPEQTGVASDLFIQGLGFFVVQRGDEQLYSRAGAFQLNSESELVTSQGYNVMGFGIDDGFNIQTAELTELTIPLGSLQVAQETENAFLDGTLNPNGNVATQGTILQTDALLDGAAPANRRIPAQ